MPILPVVVLGPDGFLKISALAFGTRHKKSAEELEAFGMTVSYAMDAARFYRTS
jgi:hypothetical protein